MLRIEAAQMKMKRWAADAPMNYRHKLDLMEAERLRTFGEKAAAMDAYDRAVAGAREHGFLREEALAEELAAGFYLEWNKEELAAAYLRDAFRCFVRWGAAAKSAALERRYGRLLAPASGARGKAVDGDHGPLDLVTVIKASQAIAGEIELGRLLKQMMLIILENAGAQHGALILERDGRWVIEAQGDADGAITVLQALDLDEFAGVSAAIVRDVAQTHSGVVLDDAAKEGKFVDDPSIAGRRVKSVICAPLMNRGRLSGIVYLENNLTAHAFTAQRLELLNLLSLQMALSLDNSRLYQRAQDQIAERMVAEAALRESEQRFRTIFDSINDAIIVHDPSTGEILDVNRTMCVLYGYGREEALRLTIGQISSGEPPFTQEDARAWMNKTVRAGPQVFEWMAKHKDGHLFWVEVNIRKAVISGHERLLVVARNITERKEVEAQLRQAQKMESIGRLAGGVAHDFNNMLSVILGYAQMMKPELSGNNLLLSYVVEIEKAGVRSRNLARQLLAFSRKQIISPVVVDINDVIADAMNSLARLIGEDIALRFDAGADLWKVRCDPTQIDQIVMNLAVNARDAMPGGGQLTIATANVSFDEAHFRRERIESKPGDYVRLELTDNGSGMDRETMSHIFEPFFTTKKPGEGTGLGLATVYGIVRQNDGFIICRSERGRGTTFTVCIPRFAGPDETAEKREERRPVSGTGTILLVEDEEIVRQVTMKMLAQIGYAVRVATTADEALACCGDKEVAIDCMITDLVMPGMNGTELMKKAVVLRPGLKTLFMSGYSGNTLSRHGVIAEGVHFLQKPFSIEELARKVSDAIGAASNGPGQEG
jgi:PAS domain S-box-containing protein